MPRLRNRVTGSIVNVSDETAGRLGAEFEPADEKPSRKKASGTKTPAADDDK